MFKENYSNRTFSATATIDISIKSLRKTLNLQKNQIIEDWSRLGELYKQKFFHTKSQGENIWNKVKKNQAKLERNKKLR